MIHLQNIQKSFKGQKALDNLSLELKAGEIYWLSARVGTKAIARRSPAIEESGERRLLLRIDTNELLNYNL